MNAFHVNPDGKGPDGKFVPPSGGGRTDDATDRGRDRKRESSMRQVFAYGASQ